MYIETSRRRRAVPLHRHLSRRSTAARCGSRWIRRPPIRRRRTGMLNIRDFAVRGEAGARPRRAGAPSRATQQLGRRVLAPARRLHPLARPLRDPRGRGARPGDRRHHRRLDRLHARRRAHARHVRAALRPQQHVRPDPDLRAVPAAAATKACSASPTRWSARRARRCCASIRSRRWRRACCASSSNSRTPTRPRRRASPIPTAD